eukprot:CAMPEP_0176291594 /NCGR_PEP_ID=MMETSP0121_2-20121125/55628_1 /TAXON_ID=160619 /ORGANISM="Kryptoperidinium foliaceum, Strain CCMP 1326" /LENGTH=231 /DNA_ID=CAMNT_0017632439 /DNA_START=344 /DNA_END=1035 /DNA_ORIENTATION=-
MLGAKHGQRQGSETRLKIACPAWRCCATAAHSNLAPLVSHISSLHALHRACRIKATSRATQARSIILASPLIAKHRLAKRFASGLSSETRVRRAVASCAASTPTFLNLSSDKDLHPTGGSASSSDHSSVSHGSMPGDIDSVLIPFTTLLSDLRARTSSRTDFASSSTPPLSMEFMSFFPAISVASLTTAGGSATTGASAGTAFCEASTIVFKILWHSNQWAAHSSNLAVVA